jgi:polyvinyl alcohol dehydrogenase (cytochrome)
VLITGVLVLSVGVLPTSAAARAAQAPAAQSAAAQAPSGEAVYKAHCAACHDSTSPRIPPRDALRQMPAARIMRALDGGAMMNVALTMSHDERLAVSSFLGTSGALAGPPASAFCTDRTVRLDAQPRVTWNGWSPGTGNARFQPADAAGVRPDQIPGLKLRWAFGFDGDVSAFAQPTVLDGHLFVGSAAGVVHAMRADRGCLEWTFQANGPVRAAILAVPQDGRHVLLFGDMTGWFYAVRADTGALLWKVHIDEHDSTRLTAAAAAHAGIVYVPVSSWEEARASDATYECCTFRGSVVAYDATTGKQAWQTFVIDAPKPTKKNSKGTQLYAPSGNAIWSSPTIDAKRKVVYVATGNEYSGEGGPNSDAVIAMDLDNGKIQWASQVTPKDVYVVGCTPQRENCPEGDDGPDFDFGNSPILRDLPGGKGIIVIGQKSGVAWGLDPDAKGKIVWQRRVGKGSALGGLEWGSAADATVGYFPVSDLLLGQEAAGGLHALRLDTGEPLWEARPPRADCKDPRNCLQAQSAAITQIPGAVFSGTTNGIMRAYDTKDGRVIWTYDANQPYETVNGVTGKGGAFNGPGPVVAGGMLFMNSGYNYLGIGGTNGNVLLAFAPQ